ncbi:PDR/VanB family oxidoreductase [Herbiconiux moechotypicola]|uniref:Ferredoxin n=1 Tax=Herbiconiux moechotypicola TaxID=637393 RepID=A0ABN3D927_9MICO|nr:PDR/VanB family oxidoreductase [Herbiconiux moechotypicola]MCS5728156.1 PDR/VanB family oxidoreductase [Herbiconiux moechotypicola]
MTVRLLIAARVDRITPLSPRVIRISLRPAHRAAFPAFEPGDHVQLQHATGVRRDYSLIGFPVHPDRYEIAVQREPNGRGGSLLFHDALSEGDEVFVSYPQPGLRLDPDADEHLFIAGGIGVTAIAGVAHALTADMTTGAAPAAAVAHLAVRTPADAVLVDDLRSLGVRVEVHASSLGDRLDVAAVLDAAAHPATSTLPSPTARPATHPARHLAAYVCGPAGLMTAVADAASAAGLPPVRSEAFAATTTAPGERLGATFPVYLKGAARELVVGETESLLAALHRVKVPLEYSCESGVCGSCVVESVSGEIDHRDLCLSDTERAGGFLAACVSRGRTRLEIML